ncbi:leucine-rich repeat domain-containing protein [Flavobacterium sp. SOK18b]|uniref:leucine-rich repeat domain-containing protein n=1 Tax=Flavobacterium sp. SOK18b TaxID=797900 RepID=UPI0015F78976|nr:leucine-rich repeat domain-containing protein [Flavobacterium sp. SOK18b]MBB1192789.1 leucine-rich repeat domain-containing protein [Flavobacterium sp. SOK18b]
MKTYFTTVLVLLISTSLWSQIKYEKNKEFNNLNDALNNPELIYRLNLSNQNIKLDTVDWSKFINLEYLSLKNDHLTEIPSGISNIKTLKSIDLSGNDFDVLPSDFSNLKLLEEVRLNDESKMDLPKTLDVLAKLPMLKSLYLENDQLKTLPTELLKIKNLENLYLGNNEIEKVPTLKKLDHLKYLDLKDNKIKNDLQDMKNLNFGLKVNF